MDWILGAVFDEEILSASNDAAQWLEDHHRNQSSFETNQQRQRHEPCKRCEKPGAQNLATRADRHQRKHRSGLHRHQPERQRATS
jgi:hypothetical protein